MLLVYVFLYAATAYANKSTRYTRRVTTTTATTAARRTVAE